jgi:hypothetical protein
MRKVQIRLGVYEVFSFRAPMFCLKHPHCIGTCLVDDRLFGLNTCRQITQCSRKGLDLVELAEYMRNYTGR